MRLLEFDDLPWLHSLFERRYPKRYDWDTSERWFKIHVIPNPLNFYAIRTDNAFLIALTAVHAWLPGDTEVNVLSICAEENCTWEVIRLLRASIEWTRKRNATKWRLTTDTGYDVEALALRVGAREVHPRFEIDFRGD